MIFCKITTPRYQEGKLMLDAARVRRFLSNILTRLTQYFTWLPQVCHIEQAITLFERLSNTMTTDVSIMIYDSTKGIKGLPG